MLARRCGASAFALVQTWLEDLPDYKSKNAFEVAQATKIYSADGKLLARLYLENREVVPISEISTSSDGRHRRRSRTSASTRTTASTPSASSRAVVKTASGNRQGASTITQQYIRNTILLDERTDMTAARKVREAYLAMELEKRYTKTQILEMYLNTVYFGEGAYGAEAAAQTYFARPAKDLTLPQARPARRARCSRRAGSTPTTTPRARSPGATRCSAACSTTTTSRRPQYEEAEHEPLELMRTKEPKDGIYRRPTSWPT